MYGVPRLERVCLEKAPELLADVIFFFFFFSWTYNLHKAIKNIQHLLDVA